MLNQNGVQHGSTLLRDRWKVLNINWTKSPSLGNFLMVDGRFNCVTSYVKVLGWLKKEEECEQFWISTISGRPPTNSFWTLLMFL